MNVKILGRTWRVTWGRLPDCDGKCFPPDQSQRIVLARHLNRPDAAAELLAVAIHEFVHAADWSKDDQWVTDFADDLAVFLHRLGFERKGDKR